MALHFCSSFSPTIEDYGAMNQKPADPLRSERCNYTVAGAHQIFPPQDLPLPVPPRSFSLQPIQISAKPLPHLPRLSTTDEDGHCRTTSNPIPASPTRSIQSLNSETSSSSSTTSVSMFYTSINSSRSSLNYFPTSVVPSPGIYRLSRPAQPRRRLRKMPSPYRESLRDLRAKESEDCLRAVYERQTMAYLDGSIELMTLGVAVSELSE